MKIAENAPNKFRLMTVIVLAMLTSTPAVAKMHGKWFGTYAAPNVCWISTTDTSGNGTSLNIWRRAGDPETAFIGNKTWESLPPIRWSAAGRANLRVEFTRMDRDSYLAFRAGERIVFGNTTEQKTLGLLGINLLAESTWNGSVRFVDSAGETIGTFSSEGFLEAHTRYTACLEKLKQ